MNSMIFTCFKNKIFCDVDLVTTTDGKRISAHRLMLVGPSNYFRRLIDVPENEQQTEYNIPEISGDILEKIIAFCYHQSIDVTENNVTSLLSASSYLEIRRLEVRCIQFFKNTIRVFNCLDVWASGQHFKLVELTRIAEDFIFRNIKEIVKISGFLHLSSVQLEIILNSNAFNFDREEDAFNALIQWIRFDTSNRKGHLIKLFQCIRWNHVNEQFVKNVVEDTFQQLDCTELMRNSIAVKKNSTANKRNPTKQILYSISVGLSYIKFHQIDENPSKWKYVAATPWDSSRHAFASVLLAIEKLIIFGGEMINGTGHVSLVQSFNMNTGETMNLKSMNSPRSAMCATCFNQEIYIFGGKSSFGVLRTVEKYNPHSDEWTSMAPMSTARSSYALAVMPNKIFNLGGVGRFGLPLISVECYDPNRNKWSHVQSMLLPRCDFEAGTINDFIYVLGGDDTHSNWITSVERYSVTDNTWTQMRFTLPNAPLYNFNARFIGEWVYFTGRCMETLVYVMRKINLNTEEIVPILDINWKGPYLKVVTLVE